MAGTSPKFISVRNLERYQHYKTRNPPWVKLYASILDDPDLASLPEATRWLALGLIILASKQGNVLPCQGQWIRNRLSMAEEPDLEALRRIGFIVGGRASKSLASCKQNHLSESESESESETDPPTPHGGDGVGDLPGFTEAWKAYPHWEQRSRKAKARAVWKSRGLESLSPSVLRWIQKGKASRDWTKDGGAFVPAMDVWLKGPDFTETPLVAVKQPFVQRLLTEEEMREDERRGHS